MKKVKNTGVVIATCAEAKRLRIAFLAVAKEWQQIQKQMSNVLARKGVFEPNISKLQGIEKRLNRNHKLFTEHIEQHECWRVRKPRIKRKTRSGRDGK